MMKNTILFAVMFAALFLSGCLYPEEQLAQNTIPYEDQLQRVQAALDTYKEKNEGLLPIKTKEAQTPIYEKYPIDFKKLVPAYLNEEPGNAYESGGVFQYVIVNAETTPQVRLLDLRLTNRVQNLQMRIDVYREHKGFPPFKDEIAKGVYSIDYKRLNLKKEETVVSPVSNEELPFVIDADGKVYIDYRKDLMMMRETFPKQEMEDGRELIVTRSMFVPPYSLPYKFEENEPVFFMK